MNETSWKLLDYAWGIIFPLVGVIWAMLNKRVEENKVHHEKELATSVKTLDKRIDDLGKADDKIKGHIEKLFENAEKDRAAFREALNTHSQQSTERHIELMGAIHTGLAGKVDR